MATRRMGTTTSKTRSLLLDVTVQMMLEEGYAAVSSRSVAAGAGVKAPLVHYYFETLDDLFIAAFRRRSDQRLERLTEALRGDEPLRVLWEYANDKTGTALTLEFLALANHRKAIRAEIAEVAERYRKVELEAVTRVLAQAGVDTNEFPPAAIMLIMTAIPTVIVLEEGLGMSSGHDEALLLVEQHVRALEQATQRVGHPRSKSTRRTPRRRRAST